MSGGGPSGLTLAIDLARRGIDILVVDKAEEFFAGSRGDGLQPRTLEVFDDLGVIDEVMAQSLPVPVIKMRIGGKDAAERHVPMRNRMAFRRIPRVRQGVGAGPDEL